MKTVIHRAETRGYFNHGWLKTNHTFSFADYYDPERVHFGSLRVLNDDTVAPGTGFGTHSHSNMEIISVPLRGILEHKDSMGHVSQLKRGDIQVMSAGTGILHSEYSASLDEPTEFLQIWIMPERQNVKPRYFDGVVSEYVKKNEISQIVYPYPGKTEGEVSNGLWIHQEAWLSLTDLDAGALVTYHQHTPESYGTYVFVISGEIDAAEQTLKARDGMGVSDAEQFDIKAIGKSLVLLIEVPSFLKR